jgi:nucleoside-diphosphate-sugar epimerase
LAGLVEGADAVIHCAGAVRGQTYADFAEVNVEGTRGVAHAIGQSAPDARLLLLSSLAARQPQLSHYARSKHAGEAVLEGIERLNWSAFRAPAVYGPGDVELRPTLDMARRGIAAVPGHTGRFSLIFVDDLVDAMLAWVDATVDTRGVFELDDGTPEGYDWDEVLDVIRALMGRRIVKVPLPHGLMRVVGATNLALGRLTGQAPMLTPAKLRELFHDDWVARDARLRPLLGWQPRVGLGEGLARTFAD